jgi:hemerythrin-like domain-containing protein
VLREGLIAGVVTHTDLLRALLRLLGAEPDYERPAAIREQILREHQRIRGLLDHMDDLAERLARGEHGVAPRLRKWTRELGAVFRTHLALEERILVPAIREADAFGDARAAELLEEHATQRALLDHVIEDLHARASDAMLAVGVRELVRALREDMVEEERDFLGEVLLSDTVVSLDAFGG